ncbi:MAG: class I SAM-dependent methyltransferase family protein [Candidatus Bathyarchaeota archaeon]|nr:class I SAM-dependent methyltransferase family protein [Candidatus Bathyarchaeota archaeon]
MPKTTCLKVPKKSGEQAISLVRELNLYDSSLKIQQIGDFLCIPLKSEPKTSALKRIESTLSEYTISSQTFSEQPKRHLVPQDFLANKLPPDLLANIPRAIDFVGEIAIVEITPELVEYKTAIGQAILNAHKSTKTVLAKSGAVGGVFRLRDFEVIAGENQTATVYKEYGCVYHVDVAKAYFSPRLSSEHNRVALAANDGETVVDLFAGVGPFVVPIAKMHKNVRVYGVDVNPDAVSLLKRNIAVNRVEKQVVPVLGDARQVVKERLFGEADRVIMNLPETAIDFVDVACQVLKPEGGVVHFYDFVKDSDPLETASVRLAKAVEKNERELSKVLLAKTVREVAPYTWQVVVDAKIQ